MKASHYQAPRTLAECNFDVGYRSVSPGHRYEAIESVAGYVLAILIGLGLAAALVSWWCS